MKRFTETQKWEDPWFRRLRPEMKLLWQWILDRCDNAGVIDPDIELASFQIGYQYPMDTLSEFGERVVKLPCGKWFIPKFIAFQYGQLSVDCKAHKPIYVSLEKHGLKGYPKGINTLQEKEKDKEKEKESAKERPCTLQQAKSAGASIGITPGACEAWWNKRENDGWVVHRNNGTQTPIQNWQTDLAASKSWAEDSASKSKTKGSSSVKNFGI